jgi:hypothetical protein
MSDSRSWGDWRFWSIWRRPFIPTFNMKSGGDRSNSVVGALLTVLLGCLAISAQCLYSWMWFSVRQADMFCELFSMPILIPNTIWMNWTGVRTLDDTVKQPYCYRTCTNGACTYCCASDYMPTNCWNTVDMCRKECHLPWSPPSHTGAVETNCRP